MSEWTNSARTRLDGYFAQIRETLTASGADAGEVIEDLRRHLDQEIAAAQLTIVTEEDVTRLLARIGAPEAALLTNPPPTTPPPAAVPSPRVKKSPHIFWLFPGVILPLISIGVEYFTSGCAALFFDPIPTWGHTLLVTLVPVVNLLVWLALRWQRREHFRVLVWANAGAMGIAVVYTLLFLPLTPFAFIGLIFYGLGLIPLGPLFAFITASRLRGLLARDKDSRAFRGSLWGLPAAMALLGLLSLPLILTHVGLEEAASESAAEASRGVNLLRNWGSNERLLRACYGEVDNDLNFYASDKYLSPEMARGIYYRVTGKAFNTVPPPKLYAGRSQWNVMDDEFTWDYDQGGDVVAGRVKGLSLSSSRLDAQADGDAALAYVEWTMEFKNDSHVQREARAQIILPPGGVVSRLTLWIDGEEREAAFGGRSQVKTAYKAVVIQRHDPVLVTTCGPDRVLLQCFPVPPAGGKMKVRLGITLPLALADAGRGCFRWPTFAERNFTLPEDFAHSVWLESGQPLETRFYKLTREQTSHGYALRGSLSDPELQAAQNVISISRNAALQNIWAPDTRAAGAIVQEHILEQTSAPPDRLVFVVDGSESMQPFIPVIATALSKLGGSAEFEVLVARDGSRPVFGALKNVSPEACTLAASTLRSHTRIDGGHDNCPALMQAWDIAAQGHNGVVVWLHGPQPVLFDPGENLRQRLERRPDGPRIIEVQTVAGPNRVVEKLDGLHQVSSLPRLGELADDLNRLLASFSGPNRELSLIRERGSNFAAGAGVPASLQLVRLWAADEIERQAAAHNFPEAMRLAQLYQLVTPVSGAVVLETAQQYAEAGLKPVDATTVPAIPEPTTGWLVLLGLALLAGTRCRRKALLRT